MPELRRISQSSCLSINQQQITALFRRLGNEDDLEGESNSIRNQRVIPQKYAQDHGFSNIRFFVDDGYTGTNFDRPAMREMLNLAEAGQAGTIIVKDMSRFGREYASRLPPGSQFPHEECSFHRQIAIPVLTKPIMLEREPQNRKTAQPLWLRSLPKDK